MTNPEAAQVAAHPASRPTLTGSSLAHHRSELRAELGANPAHVGQARSLTGNTIDAKDHRAIQHLLRANAERVLPAGHLGARLMWIRRRDFKYHLTIEL